MVARAYCASGLPTDAATWNSCEREHRVLVAKRDGALVPVGGDRVVAADAEPLRVKLAEQRHRLRIVLLRALRGLLERGQVIAALEGAIGEVGIGIALRRRRGGRLRRILLLRQRRGGEHQRA